MTFTCTCNVHQKSKDLLISSQSDGVKSQYEFIIVQLVAGLVAIYSLRELSKRSQIFITALLVTIASGVVYLALQLMQDNQVFNVDASMYTYFTVLMGVRYRISLDFLRI